MKNIIIITFLFCNIVSAETESIFEFLDFLQNPKVNEVDRVLANNSCINSVTEGQFIDLGAECVKSLCSDATSMSNSILLDTYKEYSNEFDENYKNLKDYYKNGVVLNSEFIEASLKNLQTKDDLKITEYENNASTLFRKYFSINIDKGKPEIKDRVTITYNFPKDMNTEIINGIKQYAENSSQIKYYTPNVLSDEEIKNKLTDFFSKDIEKITDDAKKNILKNFKEDFESTKDKIEAETDNDKKQELYYDLYDLITMVGGEIIPKQKCADDCKSALKQYMTVDFFKDNFKEISTKDQQKLADELYNDCKAKYILNRMDDDLRKEAQNNFNNIVTKISNFLTDKMGKSDSGRQFKKFIKDEVHINLNNDDLGIDLNAYENKLSGIITDQDQYQSAQYDEDTINYMIFVEKGLVGNLQICDSDDFSLLYGDSYTPLKNENDKFDLNLSSFSVHNPEFFKFVTAHELGHALSHAFHLKKLSEKTYKSYKEKRKCLTNNLNVDSKPLLPGQFSHKDDCAFTEEDMADYLAAIISKSISNNTTLSTCSLFEHGESTSFSINDSHAPTVARIIMEAKRKGKKITESCTDYIEQTKKFYRYETCE